MTAPRLTVHDPAQTRALLPWRDLMPAIAQAAHDLERGGIHAPARQAVPFPQGGVLLSMPATAADVGVHKLVNVMAGNRTRGLPTINGVVSVYDGQTGQLQLLLDGPTVTTRRTAAVSMLGLSRLLPAGPTHATIFGTGTQAQGHLEALRELYPDTRIDLIGHSWEKSAALAQSYRDSAVQAVRTVAADADLIITATTSATPVYTLPAQPGRLIIAVGAYRPDLAEIAPATLKGCTLYVDDLDGARHEAGDYLQAGVDWRQVQDLTALLDTSPSGGPCVFKTVGCAAWDLAAARCALAHQTS
jgi:1-piperideine-2-carboxylate/1-pyrroline-2-carboxylate reductase [NAD(P)H]